ncbi:hypothetical protein HPB58_12925 [Priestia filamentosa]|uniref:BtrH N-terminal domain-containing protein n=1 Tax=Priestia filamentosa TaxID=1402861 RepID=UPI001FB31C13|nr:BtrH N-terminal domain-containing protein [Priestia filamentosa]UOE58260.1 hypothetical protein HPB58_12925 [Priestia filamentosa]
MNLDIPPIKDELHNCLESQVCTVSSWWKRDFTLMFAEYWGFSFENNNQRRIGECINPVLGQFWEPLEKYHGIHLHLLKGFNTNNLIPLLKRELSLGIPVLVSMDSYWIPWEPGFQKYSIMHTFLLTGLNEEDKVFYCTDGNIGKRHVELEFQYAQKGSLNPIAKFEIIERFDSLIDWTIIIRNSISRLDFYNSSQGIHEFANHIEQGIDFELELQGFEGVWWRAPLYLNLRDVIRGRLLFSRTLSYLSNRNNVSELEEWGQSLEKVANQWEIVRGILVKSIVMNDPQKTIKRASDRLHQIAFEEKALAKQMKNLLRKHNQLRPYKESLILNYNLENINKENQYYVHSYVPSHLIFK